MVKTVKRKSKRRRIQSKNRSRRIRIRGGAYSKNYDPSTKTYYIKKNISKFPFDIPEETENLKIIDAWLDSIPDSIGQLTNLKELIINVKIGLKSISPEIEKLTKLEKLYLGFCEIRVFPVSLTKLTNLKTLNLENNDLFKIPDEIGNLINLETLDLASNRLDKIPDTIGNLTNLQKLYLNNNKLTKIPDSIGNLTNLQKIYLNNNKLTDIPDSIGNLTNLITLSLNNNYLKYIPDNIGNLTNLIILDLQDNKLVTLPQSMVKLNNNVNLSRNPYSYIPKKVQEKFAGRLTFLPTPFPTDEWVTNFNTHEMHKKTDRPFHKKLDNDVSSHIFSFLKPRQQEEILNSHGVGGRKRRTMKRRLH